MTEQLRVLKTHSVHQGVGFTAEGGPEREDRMVPEKLGKTGAGPQRPGLGKRQAAGRLCKGVRSARRASDCGLRTLLATPSPWLP